MDTKDYKSMFEQSSEMLALIDTKFNLVDVSNAFLKGTKTKRENIIGKDIFHVFPSNPNDLEANSEGKIRASFNQVLKNKTNDIISVIKYDIQKPESEGGGFELKYWRPHHYPILDELNNVKYIMQKVEDVTENEELIKQLEFDKKALKLLEDSEKRHNMMLMQSPFAFAILKGENMVITFANDKIKATWGKGNNVEGKPLIEVLPELKDTPFPNLLDEVYKTGIPYHANEVLAPKHIKGQKEDVYYNFVYQPYLEVDETISGVTIIAAEVTASVLVKKALEAQYEVEQKALKLVEDSEKRYNMMLMKSPFAFAVLKGKDMVITLANDSIKEMWGKGKDLEGKPLLEVLPEIKDSEFPGLLDNVYTAGIPFSGEELLAPIFRNGKLEDVYFNFVYQPYLEADETISGVTIIAIEVTNEVTAKQKIKDSQQQLQNIFMQAPFALNIYEGKELVISLTNKLFCEIIGKTESEILGKKLFDTFPETATQGLDKILSDIFSTGIPFKGNEFPVHFLKHGNEFKGYFDFIYQPIFDYNKNVSGVINVAIDVTEKVLARKKIEESERNLRQILDSMPQKITNADKEGNVIYFNQKWLDYTGLEFEKLKGWGWEKVIHPDEVEITKTKWTNSFKTGDIFEMECRILNKEEEYRWHLSRALPIKDENGKIKMWIGTNTEIHEHKEAKNKAEVAMQIAESAVKAKQQFLSNMSHEIRTPMNSIIGFTNVVLKTDLNIKQKEYINAIKVSGDALLVLINDILDLAKVDAGKMTFEEIPFNLISSISSMIQVFENKLQEKNLILVSEYGLSIPEVLEGDPMRLRQIILNLISNAVKFTAKGKITLSICLLKEDAENVTLEFAVTDTGIGISENKLEHVFDDFKQVSDENTRIYGGTGLGLAIVKQLVESQGGTVNAQSKIDVGSTFSFTLSLKKVTSTTISSTTPTPVAPLSIKNVKVLVVEDIALNQLLMKTILIDFGFEFEFANNGKIAIEKLKNNNYDIILMDLQMPEMNGFEATEYIRNTMNSQIPIIALTADVTSVDIEKCKAFGMNDYISKPIDEKLLYIKIIKYLKKQD